MNADTAFAVATAVHAGFQLTVTVVVYPALARVRAEQWQDAHRAHSGAITPLVVVVYGLLVLTGAWTLIDGPSGWTVVAVVAAGVALLVTATSAGPTHRKLGAGHDPAQIRGLLRADRIRAVAAVVAAVGAALGS